MRSCCRTCAAAPDLLRAYIRLPGGREPIGMFPSAMAPWQMAPTTLSFAHKYSQHPGDVLVRIEVEGRAPSPCHMNRIVLIQIGVLEIHGLFSFATSFLSDKKPLLTKSSASWNARNRGRYRGRT